MPMQPMQGMLESPDAGDAGMLVKLARMCVCADQSGPANASLQRKTKHRAGCSVETNIL